MLTVPNNGEAAPTAGEVIMAAAERHRQAVQDHPGAKAWTRWAAVRRIMVVHERNQRELVALLRQPSGSLDLMIELFQNVRPPTAVRREFDGEVDRRLHNYLASAGSLIDHTRVLVERYPETEFAKEYQQRKQVVAESGLAQMLKGLRNYVLHHGVPWTQYRMTLSTEAMQHTTLIDTTVLLQQWKWGAEGRRYLGQAGGSLELVSAVQSYGVLLQDLYDWLLAQFEAMHGEDVRDLDRMQREFQAWVRVGMGEEADPSAGIE